MREGQVNIHGRKIPPCEEAVRIESDEFRKRWEISGISLIDFIEKHGECVVDIGEDGSVYVEIYDDYRE